MILSVTVKAGARQEKVERLSAAEYKVWVRAVAEKGRANLAVLDALSAYLEVPKSRLSILSGHSSSRKRISVQS